MSYEQKYFGLYEDVAIMLINFKEKVNRGHGQELLRQWDHLRAKYDNKDS